MANFLYFPRILILFLLITFATVLGVLIAPALPQIARDFAVSEERAQWVMSIFLIGYALGMLPYGPLANRFGRKKAIAIGVMCALIGSILGLLATQFWMLCLARFIQAIGSAVGLKIAFTMIGDLHAGEAAAKAVATLAVAFGFMPGIASAIGGAITAFGGWQDCFLFLSLYTIAIGLLSAFLPETAHELHRDALQLKKIGRGLFHQFQSPFIMLHALLTGLTAALVYIFVTLSPYIAILRIGLTPDQFGLWSFIPFLGLSSGAVLSKYVLSRRFSPRINMLNGMLITLIGALVLSLCFANSFVNVWTLFLPLYVMNIGGNITWNYASSDGISGAADKSNASAVIQFISIGCATIAVFLLEVVPPTTLMLLPASVGIVLALMFAIWLKLYPNHLKN